MLRLTQFLSEENISTRFCIAFALAFVLVRLSYAFCRVFNFAQEGARGFIFFSKTDRSRACVEYPVFAVYAQPRYF